MIAGWLAVESRVLQIGRCGRLNGGRPGRGSGGGDAASQTASPLPRDRHGWRIALASGAGALHAGAAGFLASRRPAASTTKDCGNGRLMPEFGDRFSRRDRRLRRATAWIGAAGIYGAAQGLSAWAAQRAQGRGTGPQYEQFERPAFAPPGAVFPVVWSALNLTTATSAWCVWRAREPGPQAPSRRKVLAWWALAVVIRSGYTPLAFGGRRLWAATADAALLFVIMARYASLARRVDQTAAVLAVPEVAWTAFATVLSTAVAAKNG